jgi:soluble lytic murein transglycosylase-like protein
MARRFSWLALVFLCLALPARGELVVLDNGNYLKVTGFKVQGDKVSLDLRSGGSLVLALRRIERVVDDEVLPPPETGELLTDAQVALPLDFLEGAQVPATPYGDLIFAAARRHEVNPDLVAAMVRWESAFDPYAVSHKGARGLMQLMPATARRFGVAEDDLFDPERNLEAGVRYLRWLRERFSGDLPRILAAYNAGEGTVERYRGVPPFRETRSYLRRIYTTLGLDDLDL